MSDDSLADERRDARKMIESMIEATRVGKIDSLQPRLDELTLLASKLDPTQTPNVQDEALRQWEEILRTDPVARQEMRLVMAEKTLTFVREQMVEYSKTKATTQLSDADKLLAHKTLAQLLDNVAELMRINEPDRGS